MIDGPIANGLWAFADHTISMAVTFGAIVSLTPIFLVPCAILFILGSQCRKIFMPARTSVKREMSNARSPVLGQ
jgi:hypothetical protein